MPNFLSIPTRTAMQTVANGILFSVSRYLIGFDKPILLLRLGLVTETGRRRRRKSISSNSSG
jgi:hypothetical protein